MKRFAIRSAESRLAWLLLVTASAVALTNYLFDPNGETMSSEMCSGLFAASWVSVLLAWRWHRPYLRRWSGGLTFLVVVAEVFVVSIVRDSLFACPAPPPTPQERQYQALMTAIQNDDSISAKHVLAIDRTPDAIVCGRGEACTMQTPLDAAVGNGNRQIAALLLDHGASANQGETTMLQRAADHSDIGMMRLLIQHGAQVNEGGGKNSAVLWDAVSNNNAVVVDYLIKAGANPNTVAINPVNYETRWSVLHLARYTGNIPIAKRLKKAGATE